MSHQSDRRNFLKRGIGAGLGAANWARAASGRSPNGKIHHAAIGVGGKGWSDVMAFASHPQVVIAAARFARNASVDLSAELQRLTRVDHIDRRI